MILEQYTGHVEWSWSKAGYRIPEETPYPYESYLMPMGTELATGAHSGWRDAPARMVNRQYRLEINIK